MRLARRAYATWAEVEAEAGDQVVTVTGGLDLWPPGAAYPIDDYTGSLTAEGVPFERLDAAEVHRRWPQWRLDEATTGLFQADGGIADPNRGNAAHRASRRGAGATLLERTPVTGIRDAGGGRTRSPRPTAPPTATPRVVIAADAWTNDLLARFDRPPAADRHQGAGDVLRQPGSRPPSRPTASRSGSGWTSRASTASRPTARPARRSPRTSAASRRRPRTRTFDRDEAAFARVEAFMARHLPGALGPPIRTKTCLYTLTPDRDFVVDRLPDAPGVAVVLGAAHGYKFASVLGRIVAELLVDGGTPSAPEIARIPDRSPGPRRAWPDAR